MTIKGSAETPLSMRVEADAFAQNSKVFRTGVMVINIPLFGFKRELKLNSFGRSDVVFIDIKGIKFPVLGELPDVTFAVAMRRAENVYVPLIDEWMAEGWRRDEIKEEELRKE